MSKIITQITELLIQRRIWAGIIGMTALVLPSLGLDVPVLTELFTQFGEAVAGTAVTGLSVWSYFHPRK